MASFDPTVVNFTFAKLAPVFVTSMGWLVLSTTRSRAFMIGHAIAMIGIVTRLRFTRKFHN